jgi:hypothetical protein
VTTELEHRGSQLAPSTIRTHIASLMCANAPHHHGTTYYEGILAGKQFRDYRGRMI